MKVLNRFLFLSSAVTLASAQLAFGQPTPAQPTTKQQSQTGNEADEAEATGSGQTTNDVRNFGAVISGNEEQPKVLYIVPWKSADGDAAIPYRPIRRQIDSAFRHIERSEHIRHLEFMESLSQASE